MRKNFFYWKLPQAKSPEIGQIVWFLNLFAKKIIRCKVTDVNLLGKNIIEFCADIPDNESYDKDVHTFFSDLIFYTEAEAITEFLRRT